MEICPQYVSPGAYMHSLINEDAQLDPRSRCASWQQRSSCPTAESSPETPLLPSQAVLVLLAHPGHLVVHRHPPRLAAHAVLPRPGRRRALATRGARLAGSLPVHERLRVVGVLHERAVRRRPVWRLWRRAPVRVAVVAARAARRRVRVRRDEAAVAFRAGALLLALATALRREGLHTDMFPRAAARRIVRAPAALDVGRRRSKHEWGRRRGSTVLKLVT